LQLVASTQSVQLNRRKKTQAPILAQARNAAKSLLRSGKLPDTRNRKDNIHIILSCDQKFCRNFLAGLHELIALQNFTNADSIWLFGTRSQSHVQELAKDSNPVIYRTISTFEECESVALKVKALQYPEVFIYSYLEEYKSFRKTTVFNLEETLDSSPAEEVELDRDVDVLEVLHLFLSCEIYNHVLQTGLRERIERAMAMSEASSNAETKARYLKSLYNKTRQSLITKEITNGT
jgi:F0F1-type ATP synthase gamma subunit